MPPVQGAHRARKVFLVSVWSKVRKYFYTLARYLRPLQPLPLSNELKFPEIEVSRFDEEEMSRKAKMSISLKMPFGVFEMVGLEHAARASQAWRPRELNLMLALNTAFKIVEQRCRRGILVEPRDRDRLVEILKLYFQYLRIPEASEGAREAVVTYIQRHTLSDAIIAAEASRPIVIRHPLLEELRSVDAELTARFPSEHDHDRGLFALGLRIADQDEVQGDQGRYDFCTPINCRIFGWTGGNGVHFSLLARGFLITLESPVVMTLPSCSGLSLIVGETLFDFLCLGLRRGYVALEQFGYQPEAALDAYTSSEWQPTADAHEGVGFVVSDHCQRMLDYLATRLNLHPWTDRQRFALLQDRFKPELRLPPDVRPDRPRGRV